MTIEEPFRLVYTFGNHFDPNNEHGAVVVQLFADGRALIDNVLAGAYTRSWEGVVERAVLERILGHLDEASFPETEEHWIPPGATQRQIVVESGERDEHNPPIEWTAGEKMVGYRDAFRILDSLIAEVTAGEVATVKVVEPGLIRRAETPFRPAVALDEAFDLGISPALVGVGLLARNAKARASMQAAADLGAAIGRLLQKYGRTAPPVPRDATEYEDWASQVACATEEIVSGAAAECFALGRAVGHIRLALEEGKDERMHSAFGLLDLSRHAPARDIAELAMNPSADFRPRLDALVTALRLALGA